MSVTVEPLCRMLETNVIVCINYISILKISQLIKFSSSVTQAPFQVLNDDHSAKKNKEIPPFAKT